MNNSNTMLKSWVNQSHLSPIPSWTYESMGVDGIIPQSIVKTALLGPQYIIDNQVESEHKGTYCRWRKEKCSANTCSRKNMLFVLFIQLKYNWFPHLCNRFLSIALTNIYLFFTFLSFSETNLTTARMRNSKLNIMFENPMCFAAMPWLYWEV